MLNPCASTTYFVKKIFQPSGSSCFTKKFKRLSKDSYWLLLFNTITMDPNSIPEGKTFNIYMYLCIQFP